MFKVCNFRNNYMDYMYEHEVMKTGVEYLLKYLCFGHRKIHMEIILFSLH